MYPTRSGFDEGWWCREGELDQRPRRLVGKGTVCNAEGLRPAQVVIPVSLAIDAHRVREPIDERTGPAGTHE
jgi:hypothetical protein